MFEHIWVNKYLGWVYTYSLLIFQLSHNEFFENIDIGGKEWRIVLEFLPSYQKTIE